MKTVAVIFGGQSGEHEVSCVSARFVISALQSAGLDVLPIIVTLDGVWYRGAAAHAYLKEGSVPPQSVPEPFIPGRKETGIDVVFPIIHGTTGEDGRLQGLLEWCGLPYVGAGVLGSAAAMDKIAQKMLCRAADIPVVDWETDGARAERLGFPLFVKPANGGSSVGITKAHDAFELAGAIHTAQQHDHRIVCEQAVPEARELEIAVLGNGPYRTSVIGEIVPSNEFYDYAAKYLDNASAVHIPADVSADVAERIAAYAEAACTALDVRGMARVDFLLSRTTGQLVLNEVNTLPGFTPISMYPKLWEAAGVLPATLVTELVACAEAAYQERLTRQRTTPLNRWWV